MRESFTERFSQTDKSLKDFVSLCIICIYPSANERQLLVKYLINNAYIMRLIFMLIYTLYKKKLKPRLDLNWIVRIQHINMK